MEGIKSISDSLMQCGTMLGWQSHLIRRKRPCQPCRDARIRIRKDSMMPPLERAKKEKVRRRAYTARRLTKRTLVVQNIKLTRGCADCGYNIHPEALEFDHLGDKEFSISSGRRYGLDRLMAEIDKCDVVCANCHRVRTADRRNSLTREPNYIKREKYDTNARQHHHSNSWH